MIRFSAMLVVVAIGVLIGGGVTSKLTLIYIAIGMSAIALITLAIGVLLRRDELFGQVGAPANTGGNTAWPAAGTTDSIDDGADATGQDPILRDGPVAPPLMPFPDSAAATAAPTMDTSGSGVDVDWDRVAQESPAPAYGQPAFGPAAFSADSPGQHSPGGTADGPLISGQPAFGQNPARNAWPTSHQTSGWAVAEPDEQAGRTQEARPPWSLGSGSSGHEDVADYQQPQAPGYGAPRDSGEHRDSTERPAHPGRHSRNPGGSWSAFVPAEPGRSPGVSTWFSQPTDPTSPTDPTTPTPTPTPDPAADESGDKPVDPTAPAAESTALPAAGTASGSGWSSTGWSWPTSVAAATADVAATTPAPIITPSEAEPASEAAPSSEAVTIGNAPAAADPPVPTPEQRTTPEPAATAKSAAGLAPGGANPAESSPPAADADGPVPPTAGDHAGESETGAELKIISAPETADPATADSATDLGSGPESAAPATAGAKLVTVVSGVPRYHESDCILIRFMPENDVQTLPLPEAKKLGTPCVACQPGE